jgi:hypothetical protein
MLDDVVVIIIIIIIIIMLRIISNPAVRIGNDGIDELLMMLLSL